MITGKTSKEIKANIRHKIQRHEESQAHTKANTILEEQINSLIINVIDHQKSEFSLSTKRLLTTVYYLCKNNRPFMDQSIKYRIGTPSNTALEEKCLKLVWRK